MVENPTIQPQKQETVRSAAAQLVGSPTKALQKIVTNNLSGRLTIRDTSDPSVFWRVHFGNGKVHFASSLTGYKERLSYYLSRFCPELKELSLEGFQSDYQGICHYWKTGKISLHQAREVLFKLTQEALVQVLNLPQAGLQFEKTVGLDPILLSLPLKQTILPMREAIGKWGKIRSEIASPFQRVFIRNLEQIPKLLWPTFKNVERIKRLIEVLNRGGCLYEVAQGLKIDVLSLALLLQPLVQAEAVGVKPYQSEKVEDGPIIACIDDSKTTQRHVRAILQAAGYRCLMLTEPAKALTTLARHKPALVLMDINMPEINGYELCRMLRQSSLLQEIPIVMLTGRDGIIDKMRSRMVGANDYITKPFDAQQLLKAIEMQLLGTADSERETILQTG
jgi:twitching motility two-component system response regulator PilG